MENYMFITQAEKNRAEFRLKVVKLKTERPELSTKEMAKILNCSYSRIHPILKASGLNKRGRPYKLTPQVREKITNLYTENPDITMTRLSKQVSVSADTVSTFLEEVGLRRKPQVGKWTKPAESHLKMIQLKHEDPTRTLQSIADEVGCTRERVRQVLNKHGLNKQYPVDDMVAKRNKTFRNCTECNKWLPSTTTGRKDGICFECRTARRLAKKYSKFICPQCGDEFIMREREYYWRQVRKQQYIDKIGSSKEVTPVTCSYTCATRLRKFGETDVWGSERHKDYMKSKRKYTPEILEFIVEARKNKTSYADIVKQLKDTFNLDTTINTLGSLRYRKLLGEE